MMDYMYIAAGLSLLVVIYYYYLTKNYKYWEKKCIPQLKDTLPGLGNVYPALFMRTNMFRMYQEFYEKMPDCSMVGFYQARQPALLIRDPELVKSVLQTNFTSFSLNGAIIDTKIDRLLSRNPFFLHGEQWKSSRQQLSSAYTSGKLKVMYDSVDAANAKFVEYVDNELKKKNGEVEIELKRLFAKYTAEVVSSAAFGMEGNSFKGEGDGYFVKIGRSIFDPSIIKGMMQLMVMFLPLLARVINVGIIPPKVDQTFRKLIKDVLKYRAENNVKRSDFLQLMSNLKGTGAMDASFGGEYTDETVTSHSASFFIEGYETSSITLSFIAYDLARHPEIQQRVRDEVLTMIKKHDGINYEALQEMTYMDQVIHESMRLNPANGSLFKICTEKIELKGSDGITCQVMPGTPVFISVCGLQMDSKYWPDPEKFDPERFSEENKQSRHKFVHLAFGGGPRVCIGTRMAMMQMKAAIATTVKNYTLELSPKTQLPIKQNPYYFLASPIGGLWAKVKHL